MCKYGAIHYALIQCFKET